MANITTNAIGKLYSISGKQLVQVRMRLQRLQVLGRAKKGKRTYPVLSPLPESAAACVTLYNERFNKHDLAEAVMSACGEIEMLGEEIQEWRDNMDGTGLENTMKYSEVDECASAFEYADMDTISTVPACVSEEITVVPPYDIYLLSGRSRNIGRSKRLANELAVLQEAADLLEELCQEGEYEEEVQEWVNAANDANSELICVDFPSMY